jgi:hypothetical protein
MTTSQVQAPVMPHVEPVDVTQVRPVQQPIAAEHDWPDPVHVDDWHVPVVAPAAMLHDKPRQQSAVAVQVAFCGEQVFGCWHTVAPPSRLAQSMLQHWADDVQLIWLPSQGVPASTNPASTIPPSGSVPASEGGTGTRHTLELQTVPAQHCVPASLPPSLLELQESPIAAQTLR